jgi:hypothetical protein
MVDARRVRRLLRYAEVDDDRVISQLDHLGELDGFVRAVARFSA